jgi:hypothetical protein
MNNLRVQYLCDERPLGCVLLKERRRSESLRFPN